MVQGVIQRHAEKAWNGKTFFSFALSGQDGWYNTGMKRPPAVGTSIKFNSKVNNKGFNEVDGSIEVIADQAAAPALSVAGAISASARQSGGLGEGNRAGYWDLKNARDIVNDAARELGASRNTAIAIIDLAVKNEVIKLPAAAKREEFLWTLIDKYTAKLMGKDEVKETVHEATAVEAAGPDVGDGDNWN